MTSLEDLVMAVDENDNDLEIVTRLQAHTKGILHRISVVYLVDDKGNILIQERVDGRRDHSSAGHVDIGEGYLESARRELFEELGVVNVELIKIAKGLSEERNDVKGTHIRHVFEVFVTNAKPIKLLETEVKNSFWADPEIIWEDMNKRRDQDLYAGGFIDSLPLFLKYYYHR